MSIKYNLCGERFGRLVVVERLPESGRTKWRCQCDCGKEKITTTSQLVGGKCQSCGCLRIDTLRARLRTHGHASKANHSLTYKRWAGMKRRCDNPNENNYDRYGGRGIKYAVRWSGFENFLADMGECPPGYSIERIDVNGNYEPGNCKWILEKEQQRNTRRSVWIEYRGERRVLTEWCEVLKVSYWTVRKRLNMGWEVERAFETPINDYQTHIEYQGKTQSLAQWSRELGIPYDRLLQRLIKLHWSVQDAFEKIGQIHSKKDPNG